jgi:hypothetical protein
MLYESLGSMAKTAIAAAVGVCFVAQAMADTRHRICVGEKTCPVTVESLYPCYTSIESIGNQICAVHLPDGTTKVFPWSWQYQDQHGGNRCGYFWGIITCLTSKQYRLPQSFTQ